ncbi:hypothetical protein A5742_14545 [Mycolicibacterium fortuitum]|uniref:Tryptophanase n=1 Tax=Mycolicibacterium fortuitum TaxID=1766 RepID=A0ABD6QCB9_MYCFO|nr:hypothetical protein [Mycolicibacterium fortuitum]OMC33113.1 hypothetical protein A5742_14545 [Mycolicibacterium fortuitum]
MIAVNNSEVHDFLWALVDAANPFMTEEARAWMYVKIGAGEIESAILALLQSFVRNDTAVPPAVVARLWAWIGGFTGSDREPSLRELANRVRVAARPEAPPKPPPTPVVPRRSARASRRVLSVVQG